MATTSVFGLLLLLSSYGAHGALSRGQIARGRGALARGRGTPRYRPPPQSPSSNKREAAAQHKLEVFGPPGEWRARKNSREWSNYKSASDETDAEASLDGMVDFKPKVWTAQAGGSRTTSFFAKGGVTFASLGAAEELQGALEACGAARPSHVQAAGFAPILSGEDVALADHTGSGKVCAPCKSSDSSV